MTENIASKTWLAAFTLGLQGDGALDNTDSTSLQRALEKSVHAATQAWPGFDIHVSEFLEYLAERITNTDDLIGAVEQVNSGDLLLAYACVKGLPGAIEIFHEQFDHLLIKAASRVEKQGISPDDVRQQLMEHLLLPRDNRPAAISLYAGRGSLHAYLRVAALHRALKMLRDNKEVPMSNDMDFALKLACEDDDQEARALKERYRADFKDVFQKVVLDLKPEERNLLRYHYLSGLNTRKIATLLGVDQSTVVRWLSRLRGRLLEETRDRLMERLGLGQTEFKSVMNLVQSQLDISMERVLNEQ